MKDPVYIKKIDPNSDIEFDTSNYNYKIIDDLLSNLESTFNNKYQPIIDYYNLYYTVLNQGVDLDKNNSQKWQNFRTIVQSNSSSWLQPLTIIYPKINITSFSNSYVQEITDWINAKFPVIDPVTNELLFVENQQAIITCYLGKNPYATNKNIYLMDETTCVTSNPVICAACSTSFSGGVKCHQGFFNCAYNSGCSTCKQATCGYTFPPYISIDSTSAYGRIEAYVTISYQDLYEDPTCYNLMFIVNGCKWVYNTLMAPQPEITTNYNNQ